MIRTDLREGRSGLLISMIAVTAIATGGSAIALAMVGVATPSAHASAPAPRHRAGVGAGGGAGSPGGVGGTGGAGGTGAVTPTPSAAATAPSAVGVTSSSGSGVTGMSVVAPPAVGAPSNIIDPSTIATSNVANLPLYSSPGAPSPQTSLPLHNYLGARLVLLVTGLQGDWVQAYIPQRPNEATAWMPLADVSLSSVPCHIAIGISSHLLVLYCNNAPVFVTSVATGAPDSPTPTGSFFVAYIVRLTDPGDVYGPYAMGLSAFSNTYFSFDGGPGQVAIHGTNEPWVVGTYASHGCVRLTNAAITTLASHVVPGTPVEIGP